MTTDVFQQMLFNDGEELTFQDLNNGQRQLTARLTDQLFAWLSPNITNGPDLKFGPTAFLNHALCLSPGGAYLKQGSANNKVLVTAGTLLHVTVAPDGSQARVLPFTFDGTTEVTIANGDVANPRVDLIQMKLQEIDSGSTNRLFAQTAVKASLDLGTLTADINTVIQAKIPGEAGKLISIALTKRTSGVGLTYSENGNAITILYQDASSTVADLEAAIVASSTLIEIKTSGTGAHVFHAPGDTIPATTLISGSDEILITQSMNKVHRVQCTISVKQGTPAASPIYPDPDAGFVAVGGVVVGTNYVAAAGLVLGVDTAGAVAVLHDQRWPLGMNVHHTMIGDATYGADYAELTKGLFVQKQNNNIGARINFPARFGSGRLVAVAQQNSDLVTLDARLSRVTLTDSGGGSPASNIVDVATPSGLNGTASSAFKRRFADVGSIETNPRFNAGPTILHGTAIALPVWTNGRRCWTNPLVDGSATVGGKIQDEYLALSYQAPGTADSGTTWGKATFWIAGGF